MIVEALSLLSGMLILLYASDKTVKYSVHLAHYLKVPPLIIGILLISVGTDLPEITNSIIASFKGYGDVSLGNILGSTLSQISIILAITAFFGKVRAHKENVKVLGVGAALAVAGAVVVAWDGAISSMDGLLLIALYVVIVIVSLKYTGKEYGYKKEVEFLKGNNILKSFLIFTLSLFAVILGSVLVVENIIVLAEQIGIPAFIISFIVMGVGTSLPELAVAVAATKQKKYGIVLGDIFGSNIVDATLALAIGPLLFPIQVDTRYIGLGLYTIATTLLITAIFSKKEHVGKEEAVLFALLYLGGLLLF